MENNETPQYLPSWVIRMRQKIEQSRSTHTEVETRILKLNEHTVSLSLKIEEMRFIAPVLSDTDTEVVNFSQPRQSLMTLHSDPFWEIMEYLDLNSLLLMTCLISKSLSSMIVGESMWQYLHRQRFEFIAIADDEDIKSKLLEFVRFRHWGLSAIRTLKSQRCVPKHAQVAPRRYSQSENSVTHPLLLSSSSGKEMVMSFTDTLNSDFRTILHRGLRAISRLTAQNIDCFCQQLLDEGGVTTCLSLLVNEDASVQNYSCQILANLLLWEYVRVKTKVAADQLQSGNGPRLLVGLLTSPSACVNLSVPKTHLITTSQTSCVRTTSSVQGFCNKEASRALIALYFPAALGLTEFADINQVNSVLPGPFLVDITYFFKSGAFKDRSRVELCISNGTMHGRGDDSIGEFSLEGNSERAIDSDFFILRKSYRRDQGRMSSTGYHVSHVAYWMISAQSVGFWGVWETNSGQTHYELQQGGVFTAQVVDIPT